MSVPIASRPATPAGDLPPWLAESLARLLAAAPPPALLLAGPAGQGKALLASAYAQALLCEARAASEPACGQCAACAWFLAGTHPDLRRIEPAAAASRSTAGAPDSGEHVDSDDAGGSAGAGAASAAGGGGVAGPPRAIRIAQIQELASFLSVGGHRGARRVIVIDPADAMNGPAANALLKTLEEPAAGVAFVLCSAHAARLPATIRSRCRLLALAPAPRALAARWLGERIGLAQPAALELLVAAGGAPLAALALAEPHRLAARRQALDALATLPDSTLSEVADALGATPPAELVMLLQRWLADVARVGAGAEPAFGVQRAARLAELARRSSPRSRAAADARLAQQHALARHPLNARLFVEDTLHAYASAFAARSAANRPAAR